MARALRLLGAVLVSAGVWLFLAGALGWVQEAWSSSLGRDALLAGLSCLVLSFVVGAFGKAGRALSRGRCVRCGARTERGQTCCLDHLLATVEEYRMAAPRSSPSRRETPDQRPRTT